MTVSYDVTWQGWAVWVSSAVELHISLVSRLPSSNLQHQVGAQGLRETGTLISLLSHQICASVPCIRPFFTAYLPGLIDSSRGTGSTDTNLGASRKSLAPTMTPDITSPSQDNRSSVELLFQHPRGLSDICLVNLDKYPTPQEVEAQRQERPGRHSSRLSIWPNVSQTL